MDLRRTGFKVDFRVTSGLSYSVRLTSLRVKGQIIGAQHEEGSINYHVNPGYVIACAVQRALWFLL